MKIKISTVKVYLFVFTPTISFTLSLDSLIKILGKAFVNIFRLIRQHIYR